MRTGPDNLMLNPIMTPLMTATWEFTGGESLWTARWYPTTETMSLDYEISQTVPANKRGRLSFPTTLHLWDTPHHIRWAELDPRPDPTLITTLADVVKDPHADPVCPRCLDSVVPWTAWKAIRR